MAPAKSLIVSEIFGPTVAGEGPSSGRRCGFLRLGLCNLDCAWCDTAYTWDFVAKNGVSYDRDKELRRMTFPAVSAAVTDLGVDRLVISGGEPLVQRAALASFVENYLGGYAVEVETNGTIMPVPGIGQWNVSPKLTHSGVPRSRAWKPNVLQHFHNLHRSGQALVCFKFVVQRPEDIEEVRELLELADLPPELVWVMPEGRTTTELGQAARHRALEAGIAAGYNVSGRLQVDFWGDARGH
jgi:7-carboxy-7-deazaguanine synthase